MSSAETLVFARIPPAAVFDPAISPAALRVLAAICSYIDQDGRCWPSVGTLAARLGEGYGSRMVQRHMRALQVAGYITIEPGPKAGKSSNVYRVQFERTELTPETGVTPAMTPLTPAMSPPGVTSYVTPGVSPAMSPKLNQYNKTIEQDSLQAAEAVEAWNEIAERHGLPRVSRLTDARRQKLRQRLTEAGGLAGWRYALGKVASARWMHGRNDRGWKADFDFILQQKSFTRLLEGSYDRGASQASGNGFLEMIDMEAFQ